MSQYFPPFSEILTVSHSRGADSCAPNLWRGLVGAWPLQEPGGLKAFDLSGYGRHGTLTNMDPATDHVVGAMGRALSFDGAAHYVDFSSAVVLAEPLTMACWIYPTGATAAEHAVALGNDGAAGFFSLRIAGATAGDPITAGRQSATGVPAYAIGPNCTLNSWQHVAATFATTANRTAWRNGIAGEVETTTLGAVSPDFTSVGALKRNALSSYFTGYISGAMIWNRVLLPPEIRDLYVDPWAMYTLRRRVQVRGTAVGTIRWPWQQRRHRRMAGAR